VAAERACAAPVDDRSPLAIDGRAELKAHAGGRGGAHREGRAGLLLRGDGDAAALAVALELRGAELDPGRREWPAVAILLGRGEVRVCRKMRLAAGEQRRQRDPGECDVPAHRSAVAGTKVPICCISRALVSPW